MNVSESIDWQHSTPSELFLHRFVAITKSGQTLDGYLSYFPPKRLVDPPGRGQSRHRHQTGRQRKPHTQHRTLPLHQRTQGNTTMKKTTLVHHRTTLITTGFYSALAGGTR